MAREVALNIADFFMDLFLDFCKNWWISICVYLYGIIYGIDRLVAYIQAKNGKYSPVLLSKMAQKWTKSVPKMHFCCPSIFFFSPSKRQKMLFR